MSRRCGGMEIRNGKDNGKDCSLSKGKRICVSGFRNLRWTCSLYSIVQMPSGIPVATVAINGGANAGLLAAKILATSDAELLSKLKDYSAGLKESVHAHLQEVGYKNYTK